jgi:hypothetical protein
MAAISWVIQRAAQTRRESLHLNTTRSARRGFRPTVIGFLFITGFGA